MPAECALQLCFSLVIAAQKEEFFALKLKLSELSCSECLLVCDETVVKRNISTYFLKIPVNCYLTKTQLNTGVSYDNLMGLQAITLKAGKWTHLHLKLKLASTAQGNSVKTSEQSY